MKRKRKPIHGLLLLLAIPFLIFVGAAVQPLWVLYMTRPIDAVLISMMLCAAIGLTFLLVVTVLNYIDSHH